MHRQFSLAVSLFSWIIIGCGLDQENSPGPRIGPQPEAQSAASDTTDQVDPVIVKPDKAVSESHRKMLAALRDVTAGISEENLYLQERTLRMAKERLASLGSAADPTEIWRTKFRIGLEEFRLGHEEESIRCFEELADSLDKTELGKNPANRTKLSFQLGVAYLRLAETQNCCRRYTPDSCVFPIRGEGIHQQQEASRTAVQHLTQTLRTSPPQSKVHLSARWLLNLAYMTLGAYPDRVPAEYLISSSSFASQVEFPRFPNISEKLGLDTLSLAGGAVGEDFDNDGHLDLLVSTWEPSGQIQFFRNNGDGSFANRTQQSGLMGIVGGNNLLQADFDNDGNVDVLVLRGGWLRSGGRHPNSLLRNLGQGCFDDVAFSAGLATENYPTQTASWADYDNDGYVDLYVGNETTQSLRAVSALS